MIALLGGLRSGTLTEPTARALWDDLADIYRDLRRGLHLYESGQQVDAIWDWRFSYDTHWGKHVVDAIRVLFLLARD